MHGIINCPKVSEGGSIIRALEDKVADVLCFSTGAAHSVDEEFDLVENTNMILLVCNLEVAVRCGAVSVIIGVLAIGELLKLCI